MNMNYFCVVHGHVRRRKPSMTSLRLFSPKYTSFVTHHPASGEEGVPGPGRVE